MKKALLILLLLFPVLSFEKPVKKKSGCLRMEIMLVADMSTSVSGREVFIYNALKIFADRFDLDDNGIRIGVVRFSDKAYLLTELTSNKENVYKALSSLGSDAYGTTNMLDAIEIAGSEILNNGRVDVNRIIVLISDGDPDDEEQTLKAAQKIKSFQIGICGIFVNGSTNESKEYMREISSEFCYVESDYENLVRELEKLDVCL